VAVNPHFVAVNPHFVAVNPHFVAVNPHFVAVNPHFVAFIFQKTTKKYIIINNLIQIFENHINK